MTFTEFATIRLTPMQRAKMDVLSAMFGLSPSEWIREVIEQEASRLLAKPCRGN